MRTSNELIQRLVRQWQQAELREQRLLHPTSWPLRLPIGKPPARLLNEQPAILREHLQDWRAVRVGQVVWAAQHYRGAGEAIEIPLEWRLDTPSQWVVACNNHTVREEYHQLEWLVARIDPRFAPLMIRRRALWRDRPIEDVALACTLALQLAPGCAQGLPLRAIPLPGADSKFLERHRSLMTALLDLLYDEQVSTLGLEGFLGAADSAAHWLLVVPLADGLLPFRQLRLRAEELAETPLSAGRILVVENERCLHQLPELPDTIAILGAGLDLHWLHAPWLAERALAYWGDIDSWGLTMLARAREAQPEVHALLMDDATFTRYSRHAVAEPNPAACEPPQALNVAEQALYRKLLALDRGRLEQEYLPADEVAAVLQPWGTVAR
ncbi:MAG: hypothetical protein IBX49_03585 [Gammaproteobacteria bacterium]|nr:hypothetical protein [Gammaproteobacteria bacterium]